MPIGLARASPTREGLPVMRSRILALAVLAAVTAALAGTFASGGGSATAFTRRPCGPAAHCHRPFPRPMCKPPGHFRCHYPRYPRPFPTPTSPGPSPTTPGPTPTGPGPSPTTPGPTPTSPGPSPTTPGPTPTSPGPSPTTPGPTPTGWQCATSGSPGVCGPYDYAGSVNSNGYNSYVSNNCWADPGCQQTLRANDLGDWQVTANEPAENTAVKTYPDALQQMDNWRADLGTWGSCGAPPATCSDTPVAALKSLTSSYAETTPRGGTIAQFAWDIWLSNDAGFPNEVMVWVDNSGRGSGGARQVGSATIDGKAWTAYEYGTGEFIWSLGAPGTFAQQSAGTVDLLALLRWMQANGFMAANPAIGQIDAGWEICSTGGSPETFAVHGYSLSGG